MEPRRLVSYSSLLIKEVGDAKAKIDYSGGDIFCI